MKSLSSRTDGPITITIKSCFTCTWYTYRKELENDYCEVSERPLPHGDRTPDWCTYLKGENGKV
jgi:hypothetical protein